MRTSKATGRTVPFHAPLQPKDTATETEGCRHTNPDICGKHSLDGVCAFVRPDVICKAPPASWPKQFVKLRPKTTGVE
jgi:hypothetical protein